MAETTIVSYGNRSLLPSSLPHSPSTHQHTGASSLKEAAEQVVMWSEGVGVGPYSTRKPDLWHHSACRSKQPQTLAAWRLAAQPSLIALLGCEPRCKHLLSSSELQTVLPHGCCCAEPPSWKLNGSSYHYQGEGVRLGEAEDLLSTESSGGFPYSAQGLQHLMGKANTGNHYSVFRKTRPPKYHMRARDLHLVEIITAKLIPKEQQH